MTEESVFLITEAWAIPGTFEKFKVYRQTITEALARYRPDYVFYNHAFEWIENIDGEELPTGMEVMRFDNIELARSALAAISSDELKRMEKEVFEKVRCYLSRYAPPEWLANEMYNEKQVPIRMVFTRRAG